MLWVLLVLILLFGVGGYPGWGYHSYGYAPMGLGGILIIVLIILLLTGRL